MSSYTIPNVIAQHPRGERIMDVYSHLLTERIVYLGTAIDPGVANTLIAQLVHLEAENDQEINLYVNCEGGDLPSMLALYDTMQYIQASVATTCVGQAIGVGAVVLAAGAAGRRAMLPHARVVLHQPAARGQGPIPDLILQADELVRMRADIETILSRHTGQSVQTLRADTDRDRVLTARAAVDYGIVDQVLGQRSADDSVPGSSAAVLCGSGVLRGSGVLCGEGEHDRGGRG
jgi:ATP-dependent Clp protease protease subunit